VLARVHLRATARLLVEARVSGQRLWKFVSEVPFETPWEYLVLWVENGFGSVTLENGIEVVVVVVVVVEPDAVVVRVEVGIGGV